jgi:lysophospholipase L1-like esterase
VNKVKDILLMLFSTLLGAIVFIFIFEFFASYQYDKWKEEFTQSSDWYGMLTIPSENEVLLWEYRPNAVGEKLDVEIATNDYGFRGVYHKLDKPDSANRIAFVGDSVTVGIGIEAESTFVRLFDDAANAVNRPGHVEVMSFSVDGYSGRQVLELAREKAAAFSPDTIVYVVCMNDFDFERASGQKQKYFKKPDNFFFRIIGRLYVKYLGGDYYEYSYRKNGLTVLSDIVQTQEELQTRGIDFQVVLMPIFRFDETSASYPLGWLHEEIARKLAEDDVSVIDLLPVLEQEAALSTYGADEWHLNNSGHRMVAEQLNEALLLP